MRHRPSSTIAAILALAVWSTACGSGESTTPHASEEPVTTAAETPGADQTSTAPSPSPAPVDVAPSPSTADAGENATRSESDPDSPDPDAPAGDASPARERLDWFVAVLNAEAPPTVAEIEQQFSPEFLAQVTPDQLVQGAAQMTATMTPPIRVESVTPTSADGTSLEAILVSADGAARLNVRLLTAPDEPYLIEGLVGSPDIDIELPADLTVAELDDMLSALGPTSAIGVYDVTDGECSALHEIRADEAVVLGSAFKLWVLAELADRISAGDVAWDQAVTVEDRYKSSPDGEVFFLPAGREITVQELAMLMISISDNSATDHLMALLGRRAVEGVLERIGVSRTDANVPMLSTSNLFQLKFIAAEPNAAQYRALDAAAKRALLEELDEAVLPWADQPTALDPTNGEGVPIDQPRDLDLEWFATPRDLCRTLTYLADQAEEPGLEPLAEILEANPGQGVPFDRDRWPIIRFKGGSEPGVLAAAWWFEDAAGRRIVIAGGVSDPDEPLDEIATGIALASAIALVD